MDYQKLFSKGSNYVKLSVNIFGSRKWKLISFWSNSNNIKRKRIEKIIDILDDRIKNILQRVNEIEASNKFSNIEYQNQIVLLECQNFECRYGPDSIGTGVLIKDFDNKLKCKKCGSELVLYGLQTFPYRF